MTKNIWDIQIREAKLLKEAAELNRDKMKKETEIIAIAKFWEEEMLVSERKKEIRGELIGNALYIVQ